MLGLKDLFHLYKLEQGTSSEKMRLGLFGVMKTQMTFFFVNHLGLDLSSFWLFEVKIWVCLRKLGQLQPCLYLNHPGMWIFFVFSMSDIVVLGLHSSDFQFAHSWNCFKLCNLRYFCSFKGVALLVPQPPRASQFRILPPIYKDALCPLFSF